jgi:hypothetical protein
MESLSKLSIIKINQLDKDNTYIPVDANNWRSLNKITINDIILSIQTSKLLEQIDNNTIIIDPVTLKLKVNFPVSVEYEYPKINVFYEPFINHDVSIDRLPKNATEEISAHLIVNKNYLYVWVENRWKRVALSEW